MAADNGAAGMLAGVKVVDLTSVVFGPLATQVLADYGADVVKVEPPEGDIMRYAGEVRHAGMGPIFLNLNRGKRSIAIDLKQAEGRQLLETLLADADIFVHNIRRPAIARLGLDVESVRARHPHLLYCAATGFGPRSGQPDAAAIDEVIQAACGLADLGAGDDGVPRLVQSLVADKVAGLGLACAILAALFQRQRTGRGAVVEVPMYETFAAFMLVEHLQGRTFDPAGSVGYARISQGGRRIYRAGDGYLAMSPYSREHWVAFFEAAGRADARHDPRLKDAASRNRHVAELYDDIAALVPSRSVQEWEALGARLGFPAQRVCTMAQLAANPALASADVLRATEHPAGPALMLASPGYFDDLPARHGAPAPELGQHTREVLAGAGIAAARVDALCRQRVVLAQGTAA